MPKAAHIEFKKYETNPDYFDVLEAFLSKARPVDITEWETASGVEFYEALADCLLGPNPKWVARVNGDPVMLFGVSPHNQPLGLAWMIATVDAKNHQHGLHWYHREYMEVLLEVRSLLHAWVDSRNADHIRWVVRMGWRAASATVILGEPGVRFLLYIYDKETHERCASR